MNRKRSKTLVLPGIYYLICIIIAVQGVEMKEEEKQRSYVYAAAASTLSSDFNFATAGDWACTSDTTDTVNNILDKNPELILGLGDYDYYGPDANCWLERVQPIDDKMKIAIGNQDVEMESKFAQYIEHFGLTNQYYSFDYQNVHFTVMSDYVPDEIGSEQYRFVQNDLAKAAADPNIDWIIVVHHNNAYSSTANSVISGAFGQWKAAYHPLFELYNVDLVLQGHHHSYQRSYPIQYNSDTSRNPIIIDENTNTYTNPEGQIFLTVGTGGAGLHPLNGNKAPYLVTAQDEVHGFLNVDVTNNNNNGTTTLVGTFYSNNGGEMTDQFTIAKSAAGDQPLPSPPSDLPVAEETDYGLKEGNDDVVVENADEPDNGSEGANDEAVESEGGIADEEEAIASDEEGNGDGSGE